MSTSIINDEFNIRMNAQKAGLIAVDENDIPRLSQYFGIDERTCLLTIDKFKSNVKRMAEELSKKYMLELDQMRNTGTKKVIFIGDSNTSERESHLNIIKEMFKDFQNIEIIDAAVSADTSKELVNRAYPTIFNLNADVAVIMIGTNDCKRLNDNLYINLVSTAEYEKNLNYLITKLKEKNVRIIINTIPYIDNDRFNSCFGDFNWYYSKDDADRYNEIIIETAMKHNILLSDYRVKLQGLKYEDYLGEDGIHLNDFGQMAVAEAELPFIIYSLIS